MLPNIAVKTNEKHRVQAQYSKKLNKLQAQICRSNQSFSTICARSFANEANGDLHWESANVLLLI